MRAWVGTPQVEEAMGGRMMIANRNDGYSILMPMEGLTPERLQRQIDSYLDEGCTCDSSTVTTDGYRVLGRCRVHREVMVA